jgi:glycosyltransferase involved in cell wall biosynthesis
MKLTQVLYAGLGGHGSVVGSLIGADQKPVFEHRLIYYGIEPLNSAYQDFCAEKGIPQLAIRKEQGQNRESWKAYRQALEQQQPDIILLHSTNLLIPSWQYARRKKVRLVVVEHQSNQAKRKSEWLWSFLGMFLAAHIVYLTDSYRSEVRRKLRIFFRPSKTSVIPNGIDTHKFCPPAETVSGLKIGMCSRINPLRDHETLLRAFEIQAAQYPDLELHIAGDGDGFAALQQGRESSAFSARIFLHGNLLEHELIGFLQSLTIYVHSTKAETLSTAILQAMSTRLPLLVSRIAGTANMFADGTAGFFFAPGVPQELAARLQQLLENPGLRQILGTNARKIAEQTYSEQSMFAAYENLLRMSARN